MTEHYDIIADIHGHADRLEALLTRLDYVETSGVYRNRDNRRAIFLGDFIDRGPQIRKTLQIARVMVEAGEALAIMGNHEYNALCFAARDGNGGYLRPHSKANIHQHQATLDAFCGHEAEWEGFLEWFKTLPIFLDLGGLRVVHACWDPAAIAALGSNRFDDSLLSGSDHLRNERQEALNTLLKGPEVPLPDGLVSERPGDKPRSEIRVKWWIKNPVMSYPVLALQADCELPEMEIPEAHHHKVIGYPEEAAPVIFGHYGYLKPAEPLAPNVACIDLGVTREGPLCAYRWEGEMSLNERNFITL